MIMIIQSTTLNDMSIGQKHEILRNISEHEWSLMLNDYFDNGEEFINFNIMGKIPNYQKVDFDILPYNTINHLIKLNNDTIELFTEPSPYLLHQILDTGCTLFDIPFSLSYDEILTLFSNMAPVIIIIISNRMVTAKLVEYMAEHHPDKPYKADCFNIFKRKLIESTTITSAKYSYFQNEDFILEVCPDLKVYIDLVDFCTVNVSIKRLELVRYVLTDRSISRIAENFECNGMDVKGQLLLRFFKNGMIDRSFLDTITIEDDVTLQRYLNKAKLLYGSLEM